MLDHTGLAASNWDATASTTTRKRPLEANLGETNGVTIKRKAKKRYGKVLIFKRVHQIVEINFYSSVEDVKCWVCGDVSSGFHYGADTCEACKLFFM